MCSLFACGRIVIVSVYRAFPEGYDRTLYKAHTEVLFKGLLLHLDDPSPHIQVGGVEVVMGAHTQVGCVEVVMGAYTRVGGVKVVMGARTQGVWRLRWGHTYR